ncbi:MAG: Rrf2 family transcriptional regulator [Bdellovibrionales bacterium]|nr:Rrf2 family transcriptional regulator [Bdellovibrionales bacterium]
MIKLNRTTEYGLVAMKHMAKKPGGSATSAREVSDQFGFPFEITAKTLQRLKDTGLIQSLQGARGGYVLARSLDEITLGEFVEKMEGPVAVVNCASGKTESPGCEYSGRCEMTSVMTDLNRRVIQFLSGIRLSELANSEIPVALTRFEDFLGNQPESMKENEKAHLS